MAATNGSFTEDGADVPKVTFHTKLFIGNKVRYMKHSFLDESPFQLSLCIVLASSSLFLAK